MTEQTSSPSEGPIHVINYRGIAVRPDNIIAALQRMIEDADIILATPEKSKTPEWGSAKRPGAQVFKRLAAWLVDQKALTDREKELVTVAFYTGTAFAQMNTGDVLDRGQIAEEAKERERRTKAKGEEATKRRFASAIDMHLRTHPGMPPITAAKQVEQIYTEGGEKEEHGWRTLHRAWKRFGVERKSDRPSP
jgi:hypothetical protein